MSGGTNGCQGPASVDATPAALRRRTSASASSAAAAAAAAATKEPVKPLCGKTPIAAPTAEKMQREMVRPAIRDLETVVVNLDRRPDRLQNCANRLREHCSDLTWSRFLATDGRATRIPLSEVVSRWNTSRNCVFQRKRSIRKGWDDLDNYRELDLVLSPGERGCASSHVRAWRRCLELSEASGGEERPLLVLEDDAAPTAEFQSSLSRALTVLPSDAHVLYLGYSQAAEWRREVSRDLVEAEYVWTTVAYIIWPAGARLLLSRLPVDQPVDNWMGGLNAAGDLKAYCVRPKVVRQAEAWNVNSDVAHSDEHYWGPDSDIRHSDEFYWGPALEPEATQAGSSEDAFATGGGAAPGPRLPAMLGSLAGGSLWGLASDEASDDDSSCAAELEDVSINMV